MESNKVNKNTAQRKPKYKYRFLPNQYIRVINKQTGFDYIGATSHNENDSITIVSRFGDVLEFDSWEELTQRFDVNRVDFKEPTIKFNVNINA